MEQGGIGRDIRLGPLHESPACQPVELNPAGKPHGKSKGGIRSGLINAFKRGGNAIKGSVAVGGTVVAGVGGVVTAPLAIVGGAIGVALTLLPSDGNEDGSATGGVIFLCGSVGAMPSLICFGMADKSANVAKESFGKAFG